MQPQAEAMLLDRFCRPPGLTIQRHADLQPGPTILKTCDLIRAVLTSSDSSMFCPLFSLPSSKRGVDK